MVLPAQPIILFSCALTSLNLEAIVLTESSPEMDDCNSTR